MKEFLGDPEFLKLAYHHIKNKPGNLTKGTNEETLDGISQKWFIQTAHELTHGKYTFKNTRRTNIPKKNGESRPLTIGNPRDKIIQKAIQILIEHIYETKEKIFNHRSHGFRKGKSCHTALQDIKKY